MNVSEKPEYEVRLRSKRVQEELDNLQKSDYQRILARIKNLGRDARPHGCEKLYDDIYRVRVGDFRIIYLIDESRKRIDVGGIRRRSERTYKGLEELFH